MIAAPAAARAQPVDALLRRGLDARRQRRDADALALFEQAYAAAASPMLRVQIALAEQALGRWRDALAHLQEALAARDPWVDARRASLAGALAAIDDHLGALDIDGAPDGAELAIDGERVAALPLPAPLRWPLGTVTLTVSRDGFVPVTRQVTLARGALTRESVGLARREPPPPVPVAAAPAAAAPAVAAPVAAPAAAVALRPRRRPTVGAGPWALGVTGAAAALVGAGVALWIRQDAESTLLGSGCVSTGDGLLCPPGNRSSLESVHARGEAASTAATISLAVGGAALAGALVWAVVRLSAPASRAPAVSLLPRPGASSCDLVVSF